MTPDPFHRDNHYVPQFYLKLWADDKNRLWVYRLLVSHSHIPLWKRQSVKGVAYHAHLYTRLGSIGESDELERWFGAEFESPAQDAIRKAISDASLTRSDWKRLIRFAAAQDVRTPARLNEMLQRWRETLPGMMKDVLQTGVQEFEIAKRTGTLVPREPNIDASEFPVRVTTERLPGGKGGTLQLEMSPGRDLWLFFLKRQLLTRTANVLMGHKWTILHTPDHISWVTTDDPVVRLNYYEHGKYDFGGGWGRAGTEMFLPLGPHHLLYTRIGDKPPRRGTVLSVEMATHLQRFMVEHAHRYVFAVSPDKNVEEYRPRVVDADASAKEQEQWRRWHEEQIAAVQALKR